MQETSNTEERIYKLGSERYEAVMMLTKCSPWNLLDVCKICVGYKKHNDGCRYMELTRKYY